MQLSKNTISFFLKIFVFISVPPAFVYFFTIWHFTIFFILSQRSPKTRISA